MSSYLYTCIARITPPNNLAKSVTTVVFCVFHPQRKNEEAAALSKRLNENLLKQRKAFEDRSKKDSNQSETKRARIIKLLNQELDVVVDVEEARQHKEELVNDRKELSEQLAHLQGQSVNRCKR